MIVTDNAPIPLLMTRPLAQARAFVADLPASLADHLIPVFNPLIEIVPLKPDLLLTPNEQVVFSSANGVACAPDGDGRRAYCIGQVTTEAACARGWDAQTAGQTSAELIETLAQAGIDSPLVHLAGRHTRGNIAENLGKTGLTVRYVALYDQELRPISNEADKILNGGKPLIVPLFSPRTAKQFAQKANCTAWAHVIVLSSAVAQALGDTQFASCDIARAPNAEAMRYSIAERLGKLQTG